MSSRLLGVAAAVTVVTVAATACTSSSSSVPDQLGRVPIPTAPANVTATAGPDHPALLDIGVPLRVTLRGVTATVLATGPVQSTEYTGGSKAPTRTGGTFSIAVKVSSGSVTLRSADFSSRDETGTKVDLQPVGATAVTVTADRAGTLKMSGTYGSGAAQLTWQDSGKTVAIWDFNIELD